MTSLANYRNLSTENAIAVAEEDDRSSKTTQHRCRRNRQYHPPDAHAAKKAFRRLTDAPDACTTRKDHRYPPDAHATRKAQRHPPDAHAAKKVHRQRLPPQLAAATFASAVLMLALAPSPFAYADETSSAHDNHEGQANPCPICEAGQVKAVIDGSGGTVDVMAVTIQDLDTSIAYVGTIEKRWDPETLTWTKARVGEGSWQDNKASFKVINHSSVGIMAAGKTLTENGYTLTPDQVSIQLKSAQGLEPTDAPNGIISFTASGTPTSNTTYQPRITIEVNPVACVHQTTDTVVEPTHSQQGYTHHVCQKCGATWNDTYTDPLGHNLECYNVTSSTLSDHDQQRVNQALDKLGDHNNCIYAYADGGGTTWAYYFYLRKDGAWYEVGEKTTREGVLWKYNGWDKSSYPAYTSLSQLQATDSVLDLIGNKRCALSTIDEAKLLCGQ